MKITDNDCWRIEAEELALMVINADNLEELKEVTLLNYPNLKLKGEKDYISADSFNASMECHGVKGEKPEPRMTYKEAQKLENCRLTKLVEEIALNPKPQVWKTVLPDNNTGWPLFEEKPEPQKQTLLDYIHANTAFESFEGLSHCDIFKIISQYLELNK